MATRTKDNAVSGGSSRASDAGRRLAEARVQNGGSALSNMPMRNTQVTYDADQIEHWISDMELGSLSELRKDNVVEIFWGALGIFLGSAIPATEKFARVGDNATPLGWQDLIVLVICGVSLVVTIIMAFFWRRRTGQAAKLVDKIRGRKKFQVGGANGD